MLKFLKVIILTESNDYSRNLLKIFDTLADYEVTNFLISDFFKDINKKSSIIENTSVIFLNLEEINFDFDIESAVKSILSINPNILIITSVNNDNKKNAIASILHGAFHYFVMPFEEDEIKAILTKCNKFIERGIESHLFENSSLMLEKKLKSLSDLFNISKIIDSHKILSTFFNMMIDSIISIIKCDKCSILFLDEKNGDILVQKSKNIRVFKRGPATLNIILNKMPQIIDNVEFDKRFKSVKKRIKYKTTSFLNVPLFVKGKLTGIVNVTDKIDCDDREFTVDDLEKIRGVCSHIEKFIEDNYNDFQVFLRRDNDKIIQNAIKEKRELTKKIKSMDNEISEIRKELEARKMELTTLYEISKALKNKLMLNDLLGIIIEVVQKIMECRRASILWIDSVKGDMLLKGKIGEKEKDVTNFKVTKRGRITNYIIETKKPLLFPSNDFPAELFPKTSGFNFNKKHGYKTSSFMAVPVITKNEVVAIISITDKINEKNFTAADLNKFEYISDQMSIMIENFKLSENMLDRERIAKELEIAHRIQSRLLPKSAIEIPGLKIAAMSYPALEMGGDYFDFIKITDRYYGICIGDVAGKGVPASLQMMILRTLFKNFAAEKRTPAELICHINKSISNDLDSSSFITFLYCVYDAVECKFVISNAGNSYPLHYDSASGEIRPVEIDGLVLGVNSDMDYTQTEIKFNDDDLLVLYTDGIFEVPNGRHELWGLENLTETIKSCYDKTPEKCIDIVLNKIAEFKMDEKQFDDMTMIVIKKKSGEK